MIMRKRTWVLLMAVLSSFGTACTEEEPTNPGGGAAGLGAAGMGSAGAGAAGTPAAGTGGTTAGTGGGAAPMCINTGELNTDCPQVQPLTGDCAPREACCHRASNAVKESMLGDDDPLVLEYRINYSNTVNHPLTIGTDLLANSTTTRYENEQQSTLWRFQAPRQGGMEASGPGMATFGVGRYNCDGTYSYYSDTAAPARAGVTDNVARWASRTVMADVDVTKTGADRITTTFANTSNRDLTYTPFLDSAGNMLDWELIHQGFDILSIETTGAGRDCIGARNTGLWEAGGQFVIYTPIAENDAQTITLISQTYCQLVAFGILPEGMRGMKCMDTPRCLPGSDSCLWVKLPDSLCPVTDAEKGLFGCHLGATGNVNMEEGYPETVDCTMEAPTSPADPAVGSPGQCCDPLGDADPDNTLPACNAYRLIQDYVAAAAEITDTLANEVQPNCLQ